MRRALMIAATAAALSLSGCSGDVSPSTSPTPTTDAPDDAAVTGSGESADDADPASTTAPGDADAATAPRAGDEADTTADPDLEGGADVEAAADAQAAAGVAQAFFAAMVDADPAACDQMVSFSDVRRPMSDVEEDYDLCVELLPLVLAEEVQAQGLDEEGASVLEAMQITGADVDGDTAVVGRDHVSPLFADSLGEETITLTRVDDRWYVDLDRSFEPVDPR